LFSYLHQHTGTSCTYTHESDLYKKLVRQLPMRCVYNLNMDFILYSLLLFPDYHRLMGVVSVVVCTFYYKKDIRKKHN